VKRISMSSVAGETSLGSQQETNSETMMRVATLPVGSSRYG
jgi:hypothetical protein